MADVETLMSTPTPGVPDLLDKRTAGNEVFGSGTESVVPLDSPEYRCSLSLAQHTTLW
jgi:hypothetical protein